MRQGVTRGTQYSVVSMNKENPDEPRRTMQKPCRSRAPICRAKGGVQTCLSRGCLHWSAKRVLSRPKVLRHSSAPCESHFPITHAYCQVASISVLGCRLNGSVNLIPCTVPTFSIPLYLSLTDSTQLTITSLLRSCGPELRIVACSKGDPVLRITR